MRSQCAHSGFITTLSCCFFVAVVAVIDAACARADTLTLAELQGAVVQATVVYQQQSRREGWSHSFVLQNDYRFVIGPGNSVKFDITNTIERPDGGRRSTSRSGSAELQEAKHTQALGGGDRVWLFANGHLTFLRTFRTGGRMIDVAFSRSGAELACSIHAPFTREVGGGPIRQVGPFGGSEHEILSSKIISSRCHVSKG